MITKDKWKIDMKNVVVITMDLQKAFFEKESPIACSSGLDFIPKVNVLTELCRNLQIPVIHVYLSSRPDLSDIGLLQEIRPRTNTEWEAVEGNTGVEFVNNLIIEKTDYLVKKNRYSAFIRGSSPLETILRGLNKNSFIICGVATDVCVGITAIDGMMLDFRVFLIEDLTATFTEERQKISLEVLNKHFVKVISYVELMTQLGATSLWQEHQKDKNPIFSQLDIFTNVYQVGQ